MNSPDEVIGALAEAVSTALREMAGAEPALRDSYSATGREGFADVSALLSVTTATGEGYLVLSATEPVATALARRVLAGSGRELDAGVIRDCLGEVVNVIAGQAKTLLFGTPYHFILSTPTVGSGIPSLGNTQRWVANFDSDFGELTLHVRLPV
ncbi:MAG: chemotaxis protein CheX [Planctomycetia bacterium]|nr:chemotaxis protein CheX [Planctomycetia bacterium]